MLEVLANPLDVGFHRCPRVLLAEDSPAFQKAAQRLLEQAGVDVVVVSNGAYAVEAALDQNFDLILMDLEMPEMGGVEAARCIRQTYAEDVLPIVGLSSGVEPRLAALCRGAGMNGHICKPLQADAVRTVLGRWLPAATPSQPALPPGATGRC